MEKQPLRSENTERKFQEVYSLDDYEIWSDSGWVDAVAIGKTIPYRAWEIETADGLKLRCADTHVLFREDFSEVYAMELQPGDLVQTEAGPQEVVAVENLGIEEEMYDVQAGGDHRYFSDGLLSHNSTIYCIFSLWYTTFFPEKKVMILANKAQTALDLLSRIATAYEYLPSWLKCACVEYNKGSITFANLSAIKAFSSSSDAARGYSAQVVVLDEFAFLPKNIADKLFTSIYPVVSSAAHGKIIIVSTPNGTDNLYYDIWQKANAKNQQKNLDGWKPFSMYWWQVPGHDQAWKEKQIAAIGETRFAQEFNNEFIASTASRKLFPEDILDKIREEFASLRAFQPKFLAGREQKIVSADAKKTFKFKMWREFDQTKTYLASGDVAEGNGGDSSVLYVWDVSDMQAIEMVAAFSSESTTISEFAYLSRQILKLYGDPFYICERNGVGAGYIDSLNVTRGYQNFVMEGKSGQPGVYSHIGVKSKACLWAREMASSDCFKFKIYDRELIDELGTFVKKDLKTAYVSYAALPGSHDDHVMPFIWMCYVLCAELVEQYFIVCQTQKSVLGNLYPKRLKPLSEYQPEVLKKISSDPAYQDFLDFKEQIAAETSKLAEAEARERDSFAAAIAKPVVDMYFGDGGGEDWGIASLPKDQQEAVELNPNNRRPAFFVF